MYRFMERLVQDESGQDLVEYGLLLAFISVAVIGILVLFGAPLTTIFQSSADGVEQAADQI